MPAPDIAHIVRHGADMIRRLSEAGADPLGLAGSTDKGEPMIAILPPGPDLCAVLDGRRMWKIKLEGHLLEEGYVSHKDGCFILWTVIHDCPAHPPLH